MTVVLKVQHLNVAVGKRILIRDLSFRIDAGTLTWITGENGVGKTTLIRTLLNNERGNAAVDFQVKSRQIQVVPQFRDVGTDFPLEVKDFVALGLQRSWLPWLTKREHQKLRSVLRATHLEKIADEPLGEASGGEQQRAFLAQALVADPKLLVLDETTASLDTQGKIALLRVVVREIKQHHLAVMFITHDPDLMQRFGGSELRIVRQHGVMKKLGGAK